MRRARMLTLTAAVFVVAMWPAVAAAQAACRFLCTPQLLIEPTFTIENLVNGPRVTTPAGQETVGRETVFEVILALDVPTRFPRLGLTAEAIFIPFARTSLNPFTGQTAEELGGADIRDNAVELEFEVNLGLIRSDQTRGWISSHFDVVDKFSPAERPTDRAAYTHKLNFEWDTAVSPFNWLPDGRWLRNLEIEASLDYVASGLPRRGDAIRGERYEGDARPWSLSLVFVVPLTP